MPCSNYVATVINKIIEFITNACNTGKPYITTIEWLAYKAGDMRSDMMMALLS
jgi:hypothetical protein